MRDNLAALAAREDIKVIILSGAGGRIFCAGHDLADGPDEPMPASGWAGISERAPIAKDAGGVLSVGRTSMVVAFGLWIWSWGVLVSAGGGPLGIALYVPLLALRGLVDDLGTRLQIEVVCVRQNCLCTKGFHGLR